MRNISIYFVKNNLIGLSNHFKRHLCVRSNNASHLLLTTTLIETEDREELFYLRSPYSYSLALHLKCKAGADVP